MAVSRQGKPARASHAFFAKMVKSEGFGREQHGLKISIWVKFLDTKPFK